MVWDQDLFFPTAGTRVRASSSLQAWMMTPDALRLQLPPPRVFLLGGCGNQLAELDVNGWNRVPFTLQSRPASFPDVELSP